MNKNNNENIEKFLSLINDLYSRFKDNNGIKTHFRNDVIYKKLLNSLEKLWHNRLNYASSIKEYLAFSDNYKTIMDILNKLEILTQNFSHIQSEHIQVIEYSNKLISCLDEILKVNIITEEEFAKRYDKLVSLLNTEDKKSNLILQSRVTKKQFNVHTNVNGSIVILSGENKSPMIVTKERFIDTAFERKQPNYNAYEPVIISKIFDNTIFEEIKDYSQMDFSYMPDGRIKKLEDERLMTIGQIKELEDKITKRESEFNQLETLLIKASTLEDDFNNAKDAVLKNIELKQATNYLETQARKYYDTYKIYFGINIIITLLLLLSTFWLINKSGLFIQDFTTSIAIESLKTLVHSVPFFNYVLLILYTTLVIWIMKILVKIMLSNYHLAVDANERVVMLNTYLVLLEDGKGFEETDRKVILDNIFRRTNHGIIKDETSVTVADIVSSFRK
ncbi:MAG: DUF6161 domain-containing protein [Arcobacteraceae bacterium]|nr:DUF6161 domain-containing protein [Arcobacteraceae bacterium]